MNGQELIQHSKRWDRTGLVIASLCLVHCLTLPVIVSMMPAARVYLSSTWIEGAILLAGILVGSISFLLSFQKHRQKYPILLGTLGVSLLVWSLFGGIGHLHIGSTLLLSHFDPLMVGGGAFLIAGHFGNIHACHCFCDKGCKHHPKSAQKDALNA